MTTVVGSFEVTESLIKLKALATKLTLDDFCTLSSEDRHSLAVMLREFLLASDAETREEIARSIIEFVTPVGSLFGLDECTSLDEWIGSSPRMRKAEDILAQKKRVFADKVRILMDKRGLKQSDLADRLGVSQPTVSLIISGKHKPQPGTLNRLAQALGVGPEELWPE